MGVRGGTDLNHRFLLPSRLRVTAQLHKTVLLGTIRHESWGASTDMHLVLPGYFKLILLNRDVLLPREFVVGILKQGIILRLRHAIN